MDSYLPRQINQSDCKNSSNCGKNSVIRAACPAIFQQTMDSVLSGLHGVGGILDDLIVTGPNDKEHLGNLENTKRLV